jgi:peptidoglycan/xylan/chitin deacetylase (PgdA/CDA1 family)
MQPVLSNVGILGGDIILMFHRILPSSQLAECFDPHLVLSEQGFLELLEIVGNEYQLSSLSEMISRKQHKSSRPRMALTFDDGWEDTYRIAFPHLKRLNVPATIFLSTNFVGTPYVLTEERLSRIWQHAKHTGHLLDFRKDLTTWGVPPSTSDRSRLNMVKHVPHAQKTVMLSLLEQVYDVPTVSHKTFITWPEVQEMAASGIEFGSHTASHLSLTAESEGMVFTDLKQSIESITQNVGKAPLWLAYPNGLLDEFVVDAARQIGFRGAVSTRRGNILRDHVRIKGKDLDPDLYDFLLPRCNIEDTCVATSTRACDPSRLALYLAKHTYVHSYSMPTRNQLRSDFMNYHKDFILEGNGNNNSYSIPRPRERCRQR